MKSSKVVALTALFALAAGVMPALAVTVDYSTSGGFDGTSNPVFSGTGHATLTFGGMPETVNNAPPVSLDLGAFTVFLPSGGAIQPLSTDYFTLTITQDSPVPSTVGTVTPDYLSGLMTDIPSKGKEGSLSITFNETAFSINGVAYTLENVNGNGTMTISLPNLLDPTTSIQANLLATQTNMSGTPEPGFYGLLALGMAGLVFVRQRTAGKRSNT